MILCPHGCGVRLHPTVDDGGSTLRFHEASCTARQPTPFAAATKEDRVVGLLERSDALLAAAKALKDGKSRPPKHGLERDALFAARSAEARDWAAFAAAALSGLCSFPEHDHTLNLGKAAATIADQLFAEYQARIAEPAK